MFGIRRATKEFCATLREISDEYSRLKEENEILQDENAKLRAERDYLLINSNPTAAELRRVRSAWKKDRKENDKLRESAKAAWILFLKHGAVGQNELPEVDRVRESFNELGIKVSWEELGIEVEQVDGKA